MIKLDKRDIRSLAGSRNWRQYGRRFLGVSTTCWMSAIILLFRLEGPIERVSYIPIGILMWIIFWYYRHESRLRGQLMKEWEDDTSS